MSDSKHTFLIGVDGGGTGCRAAVGTAADGIVARATGGRANATTDPELAIRSVRAAVEEAAALARWPQGAIETAVAHLGLAGVMTPAGASRIASALPFARCTVTDDRPTAVIGALGEKDGFLVSVGTGTIIGAQKSGAFSYVGGWGFHVADQGSGAWLGRAALDRALQCHDGVLRHSRLSREILTRFGDDPNAIVTFSTTARPGDYATLAPDVVSAAADGDAIAVALMRDGADYIERGLAALGFRAGDTLCLSGGVGPHYAAFLPPEMTAHLAAPQGSALDGAFRLAARASQEARGAVQ